MFLSDTARARSLRDSQTSAMDSDGRASARSEGNRRFVSANPTGPLHVGHGAPRRLEMRSRAWWNRRATDPSEYYYNDTVAQIANLALSVQARCARRQAQERPFPPTATRRYVREIARAYWRNIQTMVRATTWMRSGLCRGRDATRAGRGPSAFGVRFDVLPGIIALFRRSGRQAIRSLIAAAEPTSRTARCGSDPPNGDDKDRVMRKSDGSYTYFVPDSPITSPSGSAASNARH